LCKFISRLTVWQPQWSEAAGSEVGAGTGDEGWCRSEPALDAGAAATLTAWSR